MENVHTHPPFPQTLLSLPLSFPSSYPKTKNKNSVCVCVFVYIYVCTENVSPGGRRQVNMCYNATTRRQQGGNKATTRRQRREGGRSTRRPTKCKLKTDSQSERGLAKKKETFSKPKFNPTRRGSRVARNENCSENQEKETL